MCQYHFLTDNVVLLPFYSYGTPNVFDQVLNNNTVTVNEQN